MNTKTPTPKQQLGARGEEAAARLLASKGLRIAARNWRQGSLELDLVCMDGQEVVFVEVKTRAADGLAEPAEAVGPKKMRSLIKAARAWLAAHKAWDLPCRFDVVCVTERREELRLEHHTNAFSLSDLVDHGHSARQFR